MRLTISVPFKYRKYPSPDGVLNSGNETNHPPTLYKRINNKWAAACNCRACSEQIKVISITRYATAAACGLRKNHGNEGGKQRFPQLLTKTETSSKKYFVQTSLNIPL